MFKSKKKLTLIILLVVIAMLISTVFLTSTQLSTLAKNSIPDGLKNSIKVLVFGENYLEEISTLRNLNYNVKTLPKTQFINLDLKKIKIPGVEEDTISHYNKINKNGYMFKYKKFYINLFKEKIYITTSLGKFLLLADNFTEFNIINSNIDDYQITNILDSQTIQDNIFISIIRTDNKNDNCNYLEILKAKINDTFYNFESIIKSNKCYSDIVGAMGGRIVEYKNGILITTGATEEFSGLAQDDNSIAGKILYLEKGSKKFKIFSKGHRNPQGLIVINDKIISTEHGPYGGDEINLIKEGKNYGWPLLSFGDDYELKKNINLKFKYLKKSLSNYEDPIFSYVPSSGISELIKLPNSFAKKWQDNFLISSLNGRSLYRVQLNNEFNKIFYSEKMYIGERIRDIKYYEKKNLVLMALEETGSLGILSNTNY
jgi:hypothetical protein